MAGKRHTLLTILLTLILIYNLRSTSNKSSSTPVLEFVSSSIWKDITLQPAFRDRPIVECLKEINYKGKEQYDISKYLLLKAVSSIARTINPDEVIITLVCPECAILSSDAISAYYTGLDKRNILRSRWERER